MGINEEMKSILIVDWTRMEWSELFSFSDFKWTYGQTPFSNFQFPLFGCIGYLIATFSLQAYMKDKKPMLLNGFALVHNIFLTLLSLCMFLGSASGAFSKLMLQGLLDGLLCEKDAQPMKGTLFYWSYIFYLSKFYEFVDTFILVARKKPLIFLHVYHHFIMPFVCWAGLHGNWCMALWLSAFWNSFVHTIMYSYYTASCLGYSFWWKKYLTMIQIAQFIMGVVYTTSFFWFYLKDLAFHISWPFISYTPGCVGELWAILFMYGVNCSFLVLFTKWFLLTYYEKKKKGTKKIQ